MKLINNQAVIVKDIYDSLSKKQLFNIPTGGGKTYIILYVAKMVMENLGKKVIISSPTNALVREMYDTAIENQFDESLIGVRIGSKNYVDYNLFLFYYTSGELELYITKDSLDQYARYIVDKDKDELYIDIFEDKCKFKDTAFISIVKDLLYKKTPYSRDEKEITITNHFYLLTLLIKSEKINLSEYVVLMDEVHQIADVADAILSKDFSAFGLKNEINTLARELSNSDDFQGKIAFEKNIKTLSVKLNKFFKRTKNPEMSGEYFSGDRATEVFSDIDKIMNLNVTKEFQKQLIKNETYIDKNIFSILKNTFIDYSEIKKTIEYNSDTLGLLYTPSLGYPVLNIQSRNPLGELNRIFWKKIDMFAGVSATVTSSFFPTINEKAYGFGRIGLASKDKDYKIKYYDKVFPKELISIYTPPEEELPIEESVYNPDFIGNISPYYRYIVKYIHENHNGQNSMILCGGYKESLFLTRLYENLFPNEQIKITNATPYETTTSTIKKFQADGGLLFATRNYNTGISLQGELLKNLFILKLPYPVMTNVKWLNLKNRSFNLFASSIKSEMLIALAQTFGRVQRSKEDSGSIHLLDRRYYTDKSIKKRVNGIIDYYGIYITKEKPRSELSHIEVDKQKEKEADDFLKEMFG